MWVSHYKDCFRLNLNHRVNNFLDDFHTNDNCTARFPAENCCARAQSQIYVTKNSKHLGKVTSLVRKSRSPFVTTILFRYVPRLPPYLFHAFRLLFLVVIFQKFFCFFLIFNTAYPVFAVAGREKIIYEWKASVYDCSYAVMKILRGCQVFKTPEEVVESRCCRALETARRRRGRKRSVRIVLPPRCVHAVSIATVPRQVCSAVA